MVYNSLTICTVDRASTVLEVRRRHEQALYTLLAIEALSKPAESMDKTGTRPNS